MPGPRNELIDVRLALSNEALNIMSVPNFWLISTNFAATVSSSSADSITHGPAMNVAFIVCLLRIYSHVLRAKVSILFETNKKLSIILHY